MEKTIKEAMQRQILSTELLNDNALLVFSKKTALNFQYDVLSVCYVDETKDAIIEDEICQYNENLRVEYNDRMVAVFIPDLFTPTKVYDLEHKDFVTGDFLSTVYDRETNKKQFVYKAK